MNITMFLASICLLCFLNSCTGSSNRLGYESDENDTAITLEEKSIEAVDSDTVVCEVYEPPISSGLPEVYSDGRMKINFPSSWQIVQKNSRVTTHTTIAVQIMEKERNDYDFRPNVNVIFSREKHSEPTSQLARMSYNQAKEAGFAASLIGISDCEIDNCNGSVAEYTATIEGYKLHIYQYIVKKPDNSTITITMTLDHEKLNQQKNIAQEIINSIIIY